MRLLGIAGLKISALTMDGNCGDPGCSPGQIDALAIFIIPSMMNPMNPLHAE